MVAKLFILGENFDHLKILPTGKYSSKVTLDIKAENGRKSEASRFRVDKLCKLNRLNLYFKYVCHVSRAISPL